MVRPLGLQALEAGFGGELELTVRYHRGTRAHIRQGIVFWKEMRRAALRIFNFRFFFVVSFFHSFSIFYMNKVAHQFQCASAGNR